MLRLCECFACCMYALLGCLSVCLLCVCVQGASGTISAGELESLLSHISELLPDLGEGFLLACLQQYGYSSELVINNILEERLAPDLLQLDRAMPRYPGPTASYP